MNSAKRTLTFLVVISFFVQFITCPEIGTSETTSASAATTSDAGDTAKPTTGNDDTQRTPASRCVQMYIIRPIKWLIEVPLKTIWNSVVKIRKSLASLYNSSTSATNKPV